MQWIKSYGSRDVLIDGFYHSTSLLHIDMNECLCVCARQVQMRSGSHKIRPRSKRDFWKNEINNPSSVYFIRIFHSFTAIFISVM